MFRRAATRHSSTRRRRSCSTRRRSQPVRRLSPSSSQRSASTRARSCSQAFNRSTSEGRSPPAPIAAVHRLMAFAISPARVSNASRRAAIASGPSTRTMVALAELRPRPADRATPPPPPAPLRRAREGRRAGCSDTRYAPSDRSWYRRRRRRVAVRGCDWSRTHHRRTPHTASGRSAGALLQRRWPVFPAARAPQIRRP